MIKIYFESVMSLEYEDKVYYVSLMEIIGRLRVMGWRDM